MSDRPQVQRGDCFAVRSPGIIGTGISYFQLLTSHDGESTFSHTGIITDEQGGTIEAKRRIIEQNLFDAYGGSRMLIVRPDARDFVIDAALSRIERQHLGQVYPAWRIGLHMLGWPAKYISAGGRFVVCSELNAKYLWYIGNRHHQYLGTTPDILADEWRNYRNYTTIFDSILPLPLEKG